MMQALSEMEILDSHVRDLVFHIERSLILWANTSDTEKQENLLDTIRSSCKQLILLEEFLFGNNGQFSDVENRARPAEKLRKVCEALISGNPDRSSEEQQRLLVFFYSLVFQITCQME